jgi:hypothetical protein
MAKAITTIELPKIDLKTIEIVVVGDTPLITHRWSEKAKKAILDKQRQKATNKKEAKDPEQDFKDSLYQHPAGGYGFPAIGFKAAAVTACTSVHSITKVAARQTFQVGDSFDSSELIRIFGDEPIMREDMVRIGMGTADIRYRGEFQKWWAVLKIKFNSNVMSAEQIFNLFNVAGFGVGVGEWRMERDGQFGCFHVADTEEAKKLLDSTKTRKAYGPRQVRRKKVAA